MKIWLICLLAGMVLLGGWLFYQYYKPKKALLKRIILNMAAGLATLTLLNALSALTQISVPINALSLGTGTILGVPGVLGLFAVKLFL